MVLNKFKVLHWKKSVIIVRHLRRTLSFNSSYLVAVKMDKDKAISSVRQAIPPLLESKYKGQAGRVAVIGGSKEYTGAPYFAAITSLKTGCDISHVFCTTAASQVIKSYSPELIVHPLLDEPDALKEFLMWLPRLHSLVVGPGLGRDPRIHSTVNDIILKAKENHKQLVIDADGLWLITEEPQIVQDYTSTILTPNAMEFTRLYKKVLNVDIDLQDITVERVQQLAQAMGGLTITAKGKHDIISDGQEVLTCSEAGSLRRCGGQGDLLSGSMGTFAYWMDSYRKGQDRSCPVPVKPTLLAAYAACSLTRRCSHLAFAKKNRHMTTSDMVDEIPEAFATLFS